MTRVSSGAKWMIVLGVAAAVVVVAVVAGVVGVALVLRRRRRAVTVGEDRISQLVRWARGNGYRYTLQDATIAGRFAGEPFVHGQFSYANATVRVPLRGHLMEFVEYEYYVQPRMGYHRVRPGHVHREQLVLVPVTDRRLLERLTAWLATPHHVHGVRLRVENGMLISWLTGYLTVDSARRQAAVVADFLDEAAG